MKHIDFTMVDRYNWKQLKKLQIKLPVILKDNVPITDDDGNCIPDFEYMESFMKSLPFSNKI
jgi:hypothetical protein